ncbi:MAG TPA: hypothetical protein VGQ34_11230 [Sphingomicrobium sp.]|jgi:hypothetical protein|nr:hypothetical protein [Sphingomicrobium sp.]
MISARGRVLVAATAAIIAVLAGLVVARGHEAKPMPSRPLSQRPTLLLLTSLPLVFGEDFSLRQNGSPALSALEGRYRVEPISVTDQSDLAKGRLLLMAHPLAQPAEDLVALDEWVRGGGRVLLLADPMLEWPSRRPLGDPLRPPPMFMDTGLLAHWGLRLDAPGERGPRAQKLGGYDVTTVSPGRLFGSSCRISKDRLVAQCRVGKGRATVVADADLLAADRLGPRASHNLDGVLRELAELELE